MKYGLDNLVHKIHLDSFIKSQKRFLKDSGGGFLIPVEAKVKDKEFACYRHLPINWSIRTILKADLPDEFSQKEVNVVDMFRRKTYDLDCGRNPVYVSRDAGYSKLESISPKNRKKARERRNNPDIVTRIELLSELYLKMGVIAYPERMTNWYPY